MRQNRPCARADCTEVIGFWERPNKRYHSDACRLVAHTTKKRSELSSTRTLSLSAQRGYFEALDSNRGYLTDRSFKGNSGLMLGQVQAILEEYADHLPLTIRQLFYRMIGEYRHPKTKEFERSLYGLLDKARRAEIIDYDDIRDDGIISRGGGGSHTIEDEISRWRLSAQNYERNVQDSQPYAIQVWCEAGGMVPQLARVCEPYDIPVFSNSGFSSTTAVRQIVADCLWSEPRSPVLFLHLSDCDPSGYSIFQAMVEDVHAFVETDRERAYYDADRDADAEEHKRPPCPCTNPACETRFYFERVALTLEQMEDLDIESSEVSRDPKDTRSASWRKAGLTRYQQLEALAPDAIARLLTDTIERYVDLSVIERIHQEQEQEKVLLRRAAQDAKLSLRYQQLLATRV